MGQYAKKKGKVEGMPTEEAMPSANALQDHDVADDADVAASSAMAEGRAGTDQPQPPSRADTGSRGPGTSIPIPPEVTRFHEERNPRAVALERFAVLMSQRLMQNEHKGSWGNEAPSWLLGRIDVNVDEVKRAVNEGKDPTQPLLDLANYALILHDRLAPKSPG